MVKSIMTWMQVMEWINKNKTTVGNLMKKSDAAYKVAMNHHGEILLAAFVSLMNRASESSCSSSILKQLAQSHISSTSS